MDCRNVSRIVQYGQPRSASTFQWYLLCSIMRVCARRVGWQPKEVVCSPCVQRTRKHTLWPTVWVTKSHSVANFRPPCVPLELRAEYAATKPLVFQSWRRGCHELQKQPAIQPPHDFRLVADTRGR